MCRRHPLWCCEDDAASAPPPRRPGLLRRRRPAPAATPRAGRRDERWDETVREADAAEHRLAEWMRAAVAANLPRGAEPADGYGLRGYLEAQQRAAAEAELQRRWSESPDARWHTITA